MFIAGINYSGLIYCIGDGVGVTAVYLFKNLIKHLTASYINSIPFSVIFAVSTSLLTLDSPSCVIGK